MKCSKCLLENLEDALKCVGCGARLPHSVAPRIRVVVPNPIPVGGQASQLPDHRGQKARYGAGLIVIVVVMVGLFLGLRNGRSEVEVADEIPRPSNTSGSSIDVKAVSGMDVARSIVQVVAVEDGEACGVGSGSVVIDSRHVLTSLHVVEDDQNCAVTDIYVETIEFIDEPPQKTYEATIIVFDKEADLAILELNPISGDAPELVPVGISTDVGLGDPLTAIGFPAIGGSTVTVTTGEVAGFSNYEGVRWIKSSVSISGGNSGGGAFNTKGELIGVPSFFGSPDSDEATDCRPIEDTNGDGYLDASDACVSMGGFINSLSPGASIKSLIERVKTN
jgi:S1-C subfamily serine protease